MDKNIERVYEGPLAQAVKTLEDDPNSGRLIDTEYQEDTRAPVSF